MKLECLQGQLLKLVIELADLHFFDHQLLRQQGRIRRQRRNAESRDSETTQHAQHASGQPARMAVSGRQQAQHQGFRKRKRQGQGQGPGHRRQEQRGVAKQV